MYLYIKKQTKTKHMKVANNSIEDLNKIMCNAVGVAHDEYKKMSFMDQSKVRAKYMKQVHGKKQIQHK